MWRPWSVRITWDYIHQTPMRTADFCDCLCNVLSSCQWYKHQIESLFFGGLETSTLLEWGRWTEAGDKEGAKGGGLEQQCCQKKTHEGKLMRLLGAFFFHPRRVPRKEQTKTESTWGSPLSPLFCFVPVKFEGKQGMTRLPQNSGFGINERHSYQAMLRSSTKGLAKTTQKNVNAIGDWRQECWEWRYEKWW